MTQLSKLYCYKNRFTGTIPSKVGRLTRLKILTVRPRSWVEGQGQSAGTTHYASRLILMSCCVSCTSLTLVFLTP